MMIPCRSTGLSLFVVAGRSGPRPDHSPPQQGQATGGREETWLRRGDPKPTIPLLFSKQCWPAGVTDADTANPLVAFRLFSVLW